MGFLNTLTRARRWRFLDSMENALGAFSPSERLALYVLAAILSLSTLVLISGVNALATTVVPSKGGTLIEGEIGSARFINPLLMNSGPDQDITALVYSGLMRATPEGTLVPDLAESYAISSDGHMYTFKLRDNITFHDGKKVTADDVIFTVQQAVNPENNSPRRADWTGVRVSAPDSETVVFTLPHAYAPFLQNTTLGILPKHLWESVSSEEFPFTSLNTHPVGSGPYKIGKVTTNSKGAVSRYDLDAFKDYSLGEPFISHISFIFFDDSDALIKALNARKINAVAGISPADLPSVKRNDLNVIEGPLPRVFGVFYNQSHSTVLADSSVRRALEAAIDKQAVIASVLSGRAHALSGPIPQELYGTQANTPGPLGVRAPLPRASTTSFAANAKAILSGGGWTFKSAATGTAQAGTTQTGAAQSSWTKTTGSGKSAATRVLAFTLATADSPELVATAKELVKAWGSVGMQVDLQIYPLSELNTNVIRPRNYDALLFGEIVGPELDLYAFWHSSQRSDPGLNLALYANPKTDALLSEARATTNDAERNALYRQFETLLTKDNPALFLYAPNFIYIVPHNLQGVALGSLAIPSDRFENVYQWYTDSQQVWKILAPLPTSPSNL